MSEKEELKNKIKALEFEIKYWKDYKDQCWDEAKRRVEEKGFSFTGSFFDHYRDYRNLPDMSEDDAMVAVLEALNREGVTAWDGDATGIVVQLIMAQYKARKQAEEKLMQIREILEKQHEIFPFLK